MKLKSFKYLLMPCLYGLSVSSGIAIEEVIESFPKTSTELINSVTGGFRVFLFLLAILLFGYSIIFKKLDINMILTLVIGGGLFIMAPKFAEFIVRTLEASPS